MKIWCVGVPIIAQKQPGYHCPENFKKVCHGPPDKFSNLSINLVIPGTTMQSYGSARAEYLQRGDTTCKGVTRVIRKSM